MQSRIDLRRTGYEGPWTKYGGICFQFKAADCFCMFVIGWMSCDVFCPSPTLIKG